MYIRRTLEKKLREFVSSFPITALTGPRQSGKTTLVQHSFPKWRYVTLEDLDTRAFAENDPRGFFATYADKVIIDEAQRVPAIFSYLQGVVDKNKKSGQFILTGSQNFLLHEKISQSLAGRVALLHLLPLSIQELTEDHISLGRYSDSIFKGFYPSLYGNDTKTNKKLLRGAKRSAPLGVRDFKVNNEAFSGSVNPRDWYLNYIQTYIERDVRLIKNITDLTVFQTFTRLCAGRIGQLLNLSSLANDCGISHNTARSWLSVLEASFVIFLLKPHHKNFNKRLVKMPKLYFYDVGLASALLGIEHRHQLDTHPLRGSLFEAMMIVEFVKYRYHKGLPANYYFWRDKTGHEIDCILDTRDKLTPIEIKSAETITKNFFDELHFWNALSRSDPKKSFLIYAGDENQIRNNINVVSWNRVTEIF